MTDTYLMEVIRTTRTVGDGTHDDMVHEHVEYYTKDGDLLAEECDVTVACDHLLTRQVNTDE